MYWHNRVYTLVCRHHFLLLQCQLSNWGCGPRWTWRCSHCACWIQPLYEPSFHQSGKMLNPSERPHTALAPYLYPFITTSIPSVKPVVVFSSHPCSNLHQILLSTWHVVVVDGVGVKTAVFWPHAHSRFSSLSHPLLKLAQTQSHSMLSPLLQWITRGLCLGAKIFSLSFGDLIRKVVCRGIHHYADGSSFPSHAPSLWMGND